MQTRSTDAAAAQQSTTELPREVDFVSSAARRARLASTRFATAASLMSLTDYTRANMRTDERGRVGHG